MNKGPVALFVLGIGRSGTSALTRVLALCGGALPNELSHANADNPRGFWEPRAAVNLNEAILYSHGSRWFDPSLRLCEDDVFGDETAAAPHIEQISAFLTALPSAPFVVIKDLQITVLSDLWFEAARRVGFDIAVVNAVRHPHEVISSLQRHNGASPELSAALWVKFSLLAERHTRGVPRIFVDYSRLLEDWRREVHRISGALAINLDDRSERMIDEFLTPDLRHQQSHGPIVELFGNDWISTIYKAQCAATKDEPWDASALDRVFNAYRLTERGFRIAFQDFHKRYESSAIRSNASAEAPRFVRERDVLLVEVERNPGDAGAVFSLAHCCFELGDFVSARKWYARRAELGGWDEEVFFAKYRIAESMAQLGEPWPDVQDAYLQAWAFRPTRAEPLYAIAFRYRLEQHSELGHLFAAHPAHIPLPANDTLFVYTHIYTWCITDEQAICASHTGRHHEAFTLCRQLLANPDLPERERTRITANRDISVPAMLAAASTYPETLARNLITGPPETDITVTLIAGPDRDTTEHTLNSFLHCCTDLTRAGRFLAVDPGLPHHDREILHQRYPFLEFTEPTTDLQTAIHGRFWLHLGQGWRFFAPENLITRLTAILDTEPHITEVAINYTDATTLTGTCAPENAIRRTPATGRYLLTNTTPHGPTMHDTTRHNHTTQPHTATLDEILCITTL